MSRRMLDYDPVSGMSQWFTHDADAGKNYITYEGDVEPVLDVCKAESNHAPTKMGDMVHAARVPPTVQMKWLIEHGVDIWNPDHAGAVNRLLDGDYKHLKRLPIYLGNH